VVVLRSTTIHHDPGIGGSRRAVKPVVLFAVGYPHRLNGAQRSLLNLLTGLRAASLHPIVAFPGEGRCVDAYRHEGLDVRILDVPASFREYNKAWARRSRRWRLQAAARGLPSVTLEVRELVRAERVDIVHVNDPRALLVFGWGATLARRPLVLHVRGGMRQYSLPIRFLTQLLPRRLILVGEGIRGDILPPFRRKVVVIRNSVAAVEPTYTRHPETNARTLTVLTLASFDPYKGYHHLAEAARLVTDELGSEAVRFVWLGDQVDPQYASFVRDEVERHGLRNVEIRDWVEDVDPYFRSADVVVQPTVEHETLALPGRTLDVHSAEGVPRALIEAMAYGRATVGTDVGGIPEAVEHGTTGLLVPPSDAPALAKAVIEILGSPELRRQMGECGRGLAQVRFGQRQLVAGTLTLYEQILAGRPQR
jgi:glycosyltransferase involved in cell wall biosynthesis